MRKVQARNVHPGAHQLFDPFLTKLPSADAPLFRDGEEVGIPCGGGGPGQAPHSTALPIYSHIRPLVGPPDNSEH